MDRPESVGCKGQAQGYSSPEPAVVGFGFRASIYRCGIVNRPSSMVFECTIRYTYENEPGIFR